MLHWRVRFITAANLKSLLTLSSALAMRVFYPESEAAAAAAGGFHLGSFVLSLFAWAGAALLVANSLAFLWRRLVHQHTNFSYIPFSESRTGSKDVLVVDCPAPRGVPTLSHHKASAEACDLQCTQLLVVVRPGWLP